MQSKNAARLKIEQKVKVRDLTKELDQSLQNKSLIDDGEQLQRKRVFLKALAWLVLLFAIGLAVLPAIGTAWVMFYFSLSYYLWHALNGLSVVFGVIAILLSLYVIIFK